MNDKKYKKLMAENLELMSKLAISEQKCLSIESAFNVSQQLVKHFKAEQQLLRSAEVNLFASDQLLSETAVNSEIIDPNHSTMAKPGPDLYKSDSIVGEYEQQIQELRQHLDLLDCLPFDTVVISREDQLKANSHSSAAATVSEPDNNPKDIEIDVMPTTEEKVRHKRKFGCSECKKEFDTNWSLKHHLNAVHNVAPQYKCRSAGCHQTIDNWSQMEAHKQTHKQKPTIKAIETDERPVVFQYYSASPEDSPKDGVTWTITQPLTGYPSAARQYSDQTPITGKFSWLEGGWKAESSRSRGCAN